MGGRAVEDVEYRLVRDRAGVLSKPELRGETLSSEGGGSSTCLRGDGFWAVEKEEYGRLLCSMEFSSGEERQRVDKTSSRDLVN